MFDGIRESISSAVDSAAGKISEMVSQVEETAQEVIEEVSETVSSVAEVSIFSSEEDNAPSVETEISHPESENQPEYSASVPVERPLELENIQNEYNNAADIQENNSSDGMFGSVVNFISDTANSVISAISPFSKAEAASVPNSNPSKLVNEPDNFKEDERIQDDKEGNNYITVQSWGDDDSQNDCLENIIKNSYDLEAMGIQYGSEEYYELQNEIMKSNPEIFAQNGVNSVLYDNDKIKLPSFKSQKQTTEENNQKEQTDSLKTSMQSMLEQEERELNAEKKSGGLWDSAKSLFGYGTNEQEKIINEKKAALAKAMASGNEEDLINAYKLINKDKPVYIDAAGKIVDVSALSEEETKKYNKTTVGDLTSNENIASLMQNEGKKTKEAEDNIKAIEMGLVECNGQPVSMEQISSILKAQTENTEQNFNNAAKRQGPPGKFVSFVNNYLGLGTTKDDMKAQIDLQKQLIKELEQCKNPSEYAAKFKQVTGQDFNSSSIMQLLAYNQLTSGESVNPSENTPKSGKIDIGSGVTNIAEAVKKDNKGNKDVLSLTQNSKAQKFIDEYKDTQKAVKNGAIGIITAPISLAAMSFAPFTGGLSLLVGAGVGAALSTGINAIDSIYDADGDGSLDFNYTRDDLLKDGLIGSANGFFLGTGSLVKNALFSFAKAKLANTAAQRLMTPALEKLINNQAAKMTGKLADTAATNFVDGAGYAGTAYTVETAFDKNAEFSGEKLVESMIEGGSMGSALGVGGHAVMKAASNTPKVISKAADKLPDVSGKFSEIASKANAKIEQAADKAADKIINAEAKLENAMNKADDVLIDAQDKFFETTDILKNKTKNLVDGAQNFANELKVETSALKDGLSDLASKFKDKVIGFKEKFSGGEVTAVKDLRNIKNETQLPQGQSVVNKNTKLVINDKTEIDLSKFDGLEEGKLYIINRLDGSIQEVPNHAIDGEQFIFITKRDNGFEIGDWSTKQNIKLTPSNVNQTGESLSDKFSNFKSEVSDLASDAKSAFKEKVSGLKDDVSDLASEAKSAFKEKTSNLKNELNDLVSSSKDKINNFKEKSNSDTAIDKNDFTSITAETKLPQGFSVVSSETKLAIGKDIEIDLNKIQGLQEGKQYILNRFEGSIQEVPKHAIDGEQYILITKKGNNFEIGDFSKEQNLSIKPGKPDESAAATTDAAKVETPKVPTHSRPIDRSIETQKAHYDFSKNNHILKNMNNSKNKEYWANHYAQPIHGPWKMHVYADTETEWRELVNILGEYLNKNKVNWKTLSKDYNMELLNTAGNQKGKAFTIYPTDVENFKKIATDIEKLLKDNKMQIENSNIKGDKALGESGRLFYRYEYKSGKNADELINLRDNDEARRYLNELYDENRGENNYLANDMTPNDDPFLHFNPSGKAETNFEMPKQEPVNTKTQNENSFDANLSDYRNAPEGTVIPKDKLIFINGDAKIKLFTGVEVDLNSNAFKSIKDGEIIDVNKDGLPYNTTLFDMETPQLQLQKIGDNYTVYNIFGMSPKIISTGTSLNSEEVNNIARMIEANIFPSKAQLYAKNFDKEHIDKIIESVKNKTDFNDLVIDSSSIKKIVVKDGFPECQIIDINALGKSYSLADIDDITPQLFETINKLKYGLRQDSSINDFRLKIGDNEVQILTDNNMVSQEFARKNGIPKDGTVLTNEVAKAFDDALKQMYKMGQPIPEKVYFSSLFGYDKELEGLAAGHFGRRADPNAIFVNSGTVSNISYLKKTIYHETAHMNDHNLADKEDWKTFLSDKDVEISPITKDSQVIEFNGKKIDKNPIGYLISDYALTDKQEFVAEIASLITEGTLYKTKDGHYRMHTDEIDNFPNAKEVVVEFNPDIDGKALDDIMELYNYLTEGKIVNPKVE